MIKEPPQFLRVDGLDANGIKVKIVGKTGSDDAWDVKGAFYKLLISELKKANIPLPRNQITVANADEDISKKQLSIEAGSIQPILPVPGKLLLTSQLSAKCLTPVFLAVFAGRT